MSQRGRFTGGDDWPITPAPAGQVFNVPAQLAQGNAMGVSVRSIGDFHGVGDWVVKICPISGNTAAGVNVYQPLIVDWKLYAKIDVGFGEATGTEWESNTFVSTGDPQPMLVPINGKCIQVHGNFVRVRLFRNSNINSPTVPVLVSIVPGYVAEQTMEIFVDAAGAGSEVRFPVPAYATEVRIIPDGGPSAGDEVRFRQANAGAAIILSAPTAMQWFPIDPRASVVGFLGNGALGDALYQFKIRS